MQVLWVTNSPLTIHLDSWRPEFPSKDGIFRCSYCAGILSGEEEDNVIDDQYLQDISDALSEANTERLMELHLHGFISLSTLALNMTTFCTNITKLTFERIGNMDEVLPKLDVLLPELSQLSTLYVGRSIIGSAGWSALSSLLRNPSCAIKKLHLRNVRYAPIMGDENILKIANALKYNKSLQHLTLTWHTEGPSGEELAESVLAEISNAVCDTSSSDSIHSSNHTLFTINFMEFRVPKLTLPPTLQIAMTLNELLSVGQRWSRVEPGGLLTTKIVLLSHVNDVKPLLVYDLKMLPILQNWFSRATVCMEYLRLYYPMDENMGLLGLPPRRKDILKDRLSCVYQFVGANSKHVAKSMKIAYISKRETSGRLIKNGKRTMIHGWHAKHPLKQVQLQKHWACHGCEYTDPDVLPLWRDDVRYRCSKCDYDLCKLCFNEGIEFGNSCNRRADEGQDGAQSRGASSRPIQRTRTGRRNSTMQRRRRCTINMRGDKIVEKII